MKTILGALAVAMLLGTVSAVPANAACWDTPWGVRCSYHHYWHHPWGYWRHPW